MRYAASFAVVALLSIELVACASLSGHRGDPTEEEGVPVNLRVDCDTNLFFSRYDVEVFVDGESYGVLPHGEDEVFELNLTEGEHVFRAEEDDDSGVSGEETFVVSGEGKAGFSIHCTSSEVQVEEIDTAVPPFASHDAAGQNKDDVEDAFRDAGFTDVSFVEIRDLGRDEADAVMTVASVSIGGAQDYSAEESFYEDEEVVISYRLPEDVVVPASSDELVGTNYPEVVSQFEAAGFAEVTAEAVSSHDPDFAVDAVVGIDIDDGSFLPESSFDSGQAFPYESTVVVRYNMPAPVEESEDPNDNWDLEWEARQTFERFGQILYPYGFECHWMMDLVNCEPQGDGAYFIKVGVTITNEYGVERRTYAQGIAGNGNVTDFLVS